MVKELTSRNITHVYNVGVAGDYCVKSTAVDAARAGFVSYVVDEAVASVDKGGEGWGAACKEFEESGVKLIGIDGEEVKRVKDLKEE